MKRQLILLVFLLVFSLFVDAKTQTKIAGKKAPVCLTLQAENGSIKQKRNADGTITCIIQPEDVIKVSSIVLNGMNITNQLENNKLTLPLLTQDSTLEVTFESISLNIKTNYNTIAMY